MLVRRKTDLEFDAFRYSGDLNTFVTWLSTKSDFVSLTVNSSLNVTVATNSGNSFNLVNSDVLRVTTDNLLDKISSANFDTNWEPV